MTISVIIPVLNEEKALPVLLDTLQKQSGIKEILVVDGGSTDRTCAIVGSYEAHLVTGVSGRGQQLRAGAEMATGDILWFLHADTLPGSGAADAICACLQEPRFEGGNFRIVFDGETDFTYWLTGFYEWLRSHGIYYGDSAIFVRQSTYHQIGGFQPIALMEDFAFVRALEALGPTANIDTPPVTSSSRRFDGRSKPGIILQWVLIHLLYYLKASPGWMARLYKSRDHQPGLSNEQ